MYIISKKHYLCNGTKVLLSHFSILYYNSIMKKLKYKQKILMEYFILLSTAIGFLLLFSLWTTPLLPKWYGCDASFFSMAGRGILEGWVPYVDFFDLKGPYFFMLQALGQLFCRGRLGIFILQIPFLFLSLVLLYKLSLLYLSKKQSIFVIGTFLFVYIAMLWGGNTLEEYCLPVNLLCMYTATKMIKNEDFAELSKYSFLYGICFGFILFSKISVAAPLIGILTTVGILLLLKKDYHRLLQYLLYFIGGLSAISFPVILYFGRKGALPDMLYAVFAFAFRRSVDFGETFNLTWELKIFGCMFAMVFALLHKKELQSGMRLLLIITSFITYVAMHFGTPFLYYFTTTLPVFIIAMILFLAVYRPLTIGTSLKQLVCIAIFIIFIGFYENQSMDTIKTAVNDRDNESYASYYQNAIDLATFIPDWEKGDVYCFNVDMIWFEINDILPSYKYPVNTPFFVALDPDIKKNIENYLTNTPPKWIVASNGIQEEMDFVGELLDKKYTPIASNDIGELYLLKE